MEKVSSIETFNSVNAMISAGEVQLNKISQYLTDIPDEATAELLVSPKDTATILRRNLGRWVEDLKAIRRINEAHGLHSDGQLLKGMQVSDHDEEIGYWKPAEEYIAVELRAAWKQAKNSGQDVTTDLFIGTKEIVHGHGIRTDDITLSNNLYSRKEVIGEQGGPFVTQRRSDYAHQQWSSTESPDNSSGVYVVNFMNGVSGWTHKKNITYSSRPVALRILAPRP